MAPTPLTVLTPVPLWWAAVGRGSPGWSRRSTGGLVQRPPARAVVHPRRALVARAPVARATRRGPGPRRPRTLVFLTTFDGSSILYIDRVRPRRAGPHRGPVRRCARLSGTFRFRPVPATSTSTCIPSTTPGPPSPRRRRPRSRRRSRCATASPRSSAAPTSAGATSARRGVERLPHRRPGPRRMTAATEALVVLARVRTGRGR
jgi:hypothetical protein